MSQTSYLDINRESYEWLADEFAEKIDLRAKNTELVVRKFMEHGILGKKSRILELGPGSGYASKLMCDAGAKVMSIEFSPKMARIAQRTAPLSNVVVSDFLSYNFKNQVFDGVFAMAFVHLFPENDAIRVVEKISNLLTIGGVALISTTKHEYNEEGIFEKTNFSTHKARRYRHRYNKEAMMDLLGNFFKSITCTEDHDKEGDRTWMNFFVTKEEMA